MQLNKHVHFGSIQEEIIFQLLTRGAFSLSLSNFDFIYINLA